MKQRVKKEREQLKKEKEEWSKHADEEEMKLSKGALSMILDKNFVRKHSRGARLFRRNNLARPLPRMTSAYGEFESA